MPALSGITVKLEFAGPVVFALGLLLFGSISLASGQFIPRLQPIPEAFEISSALARLNGVLIVALSGSMLVKPLQGPAAALLAAYLSTWLLVAQLPQLLFEALDIVHLASLLQLAAIVAALVILAFSKESVSIVSARLGRIVFGGMLLLFAAVHVQDQGSVAAMVPEWIPFAPVWPWITASAHLAAGLSFLTGLKLQLGGMLLGAMYGSWVPIVHAPRIMASPGSFEEWASGALAVTLAGAAWLVAGSGQGRPNSATAIVPT